MKNTVILIIGAPASGKFTLAQCLAKKFKHTHVVDNHSVNNMFFKYMDLTQNLVDDIVFDYIKRAKEILREFLTKEVNKEDNLIFTGCIDVANKPSYDRALETAKARGATFIPITLKCEENELLNRLDTPERRAYMKLTDKDIFLEVNGEFEEFISKHENQITLNNTSQSAEETFAVVLEKIEQITQRK